MTEIAGMRYHLSHLGNYWTCLYCGNALFSEKSVHEHLDKNKYWYCASFERRKKKEEKDE